MYFLYFRQKHKDVLRLRLPHISVINTNSHTVYLHVLETAGLITAALAAVFTKQRQLALVGAGKANEGCHHCCCTYQAHFRKFIIFIQSVLKRKKTNRFNGEFKLLLQ